MENDIEAYGIHTGVQKVMCDTSVLFPPTTRKILVGAAVDGLFDFYWSPWIVAELNRTLTWNWIKKRRGSEDECSESSNKMMRHILPFFRTIDPLPPYEDGKDVIPDLNDLPIWAAAKLAHVDFLVSNNTKDFPFINTSRQYVYEGIEWITAKDFINRFILINANGQRL